MEFWILLCLLSVCHFKLGISEVELQQLVVPGQALLGSKVSLVCSFNLVNGDVLYSVKWYKDGQEFYRFVPSDNPQKMVFPLPGVQLQLDESNETTVTMSPVSLKTGGNFRCEVSGEAPTFHTVANASPLQIISLPDRGPTIIGGRTHYSPGDKVRLACISGPAKPPPHLSWTINGQLVNGSFLKGPYTSPDDRGLETSRLWLEFTLGDEHFTRAGLVRFKCYSTIETLYWSSQEQNSSTWQDPATQAHVTFSSSSDLRSSTPQYNLLITMILTALLSS